MRIEQAEKLLFEKGGKREAWVRHSQVVREVAVLVGGRLPGMLDLETLACAALLHDIGRSVTHGLWHPWEGWLILSPLCGPLVARPALTHWLKGRTRRRVLRTSPGIDQERVGLIFARVPSRPMTLVDLVVSLADAMVAHDRVVSLATRFADLRSRYGENPWLEDAGRISRAQCSRLSRQAGLDLEEMILHTLAP